MINSISKITHKFLPLPFYHNEDRKVTSIDINVFKSYLAQYNPTHIFLCSDNDPKGTHKKIYEIATDAINECYQTKPILFQYIGAWKPFIEWRPELTIPINREFEDHIKQSWDCYVSQEKLLVNSDDKRTLHQI